MKRLSIICLLALFMASCSQTQQMQDTKSSNSETYQNLDFPELDNFQKPEVETFTASNGAKFFLVEDHELPLIKVNTIVNTGGVQVPNNKAGLASITGKVMRSGGTKDIPSDSLNALLENKAASIETGISFSSGGASMNVLKEDFDSLLPVFLDVLTDPAFPKDKIKLAKKQAKSNISRRNDNSRQIGTREFKRIIYGKNSVYGRNTEYATVNNISREDLVQFHNNNYVGENMMIGVVGDFDASEMKEKLRNSFGDISSGQENNLDFPDINYKPESSINFISKSDVNQSQIIMGHIGGLRDNPDYAHIQVLNRVLSGGFSGRIMQVLRTEKGLAYSPGGSYSMNSFYPGIFYVAIKTKSKTTAEAIDAAKKEIERLQNEPISEKELKDTKDQILNSSVFEYDSYEQVLSQQMSYDYRGLPSDAYSQYIEGVKSTTVQDIQEAAKKYFNPEKLQIVVVGNKDEIGDQLQKYGDVNKIDISIPEPGSGEAKMVKGDAKKGKQMLSNMRDAVISSGTELNTLSVSGKVTARGRKMATTMKINYPDTIKQTIQAPVGKLKLKYQGGSGSMIVRGQERPMPPQMAKGLKSTLNKSFLAIAKNTSKVDPQYLGTEKVEGTSYNKVNITVDGSNIKLLLNQETSYPDIIRYKQFNSRKGSQVSIEQHNSDWHTKGGVAYPYSQITYQNGKKGGVANYKSHSVNK